MGWQVKDAKQRFSELIRKAQEDGPQLVTRHGEEVAVLLSAEDYRRLRGQRGKEFKNYLREGPDFTGLDIERSKTPSRRVEL